MHFTIERSKQFIIAISLLHALTLVVDGVISKDSSEPFILDVDDNPIISGLFHSSDKMPKQLFDKLEGEILSDELEDCTSVCPDGWEFINSTGMCKAPDSYKGFCDQLMDFSSFTEEAKADWASSCDAYWKSCSELKNSKTSQKDDRFVRCKSGYNLSLCPSGFKFNKISHCIPIYGIYQGPCLVNVDFSTFSAKDKIEWSKACKVDWPCNDEDYETFNKCPINWEMKLGYCIPPINYKGPCNFKNSFTYYTPEMKRDFCTKCQIYCANENVQNSDIAEKQDYLNWDKPCPEGWAEFDRGDEIWCKPGDGVEKCLREMTFKSEIFKRAWASYCNQPWESLDKNNYDNKIHSLFKGFSGPL